MYRDRFSPVSAEGGTASLVGETPRDARGVFTGEGPSGSRPRSQRDAA